MDFYIDVAAMLFTLWHFFISDNEWFVVFVELNCNFSADLIALLCRARRVINLNYYITN